MHTGAWNNRGSKSLIIQSKYCIFVACVLLVVLGGYVYRDYKLREVQLFEDYYERFNTTGEVVKSGLVSLMLAGQGREFKFFLPTLAYPDLKTIRLYGQDGSVISSSIPGEAEALASKKIIPISDRGMSGPGGFTSSIFLTIYNNKVCHRCHSPEKDILSVLNVEFSTQSLKRKLEDLRKESFFTFCLMFALSFIPLWLFMAYFINRPFGHIMRGLQKASLGDFSVRFPELKGAEMGMLSRSLNSAFSQIEVMKRKLEAYHREAIRKMEKMASLGELAAAVAHEIKNPLAGISGAIQVLAEDLPENDSRREIIKEILGEIDRLDQSIRNLLVFAKPPELRTVRTEILPVLERAGRLIGRQAEEQGVKMETFVADGTAPLEVDPEQMQQVFLNIMLNALHSMPGGGSLRLSVYPNAELASVEVAFSDTGVGISRDAIKEIFKPFFTTRHSGTGLGLAISKNIVEQHGGSIEVESQPGLGSTFRVIIPYKIVSKKDDHPNADEQS
jgi:signal transduction histidine kinase